MTVTLSVAVMAHKKRSAHVADLRRRLKLPADRVVWDRINDRHETGKRAIAAFDPACTHHLVLQDDVVPCRDLLAGAARAVEATPGNVPVSLYTGRVRPFEDEIKKAVARARNADAVWLVMQGIYWGPAVILPTADIPGLLDWWDADGAEVTNYDRRMSIYFGLQDRDCWYTRPSLVEHREGRSLVRPSANRRRHAYGFIGDQSSPLDVDWGGRKVVIRDSAKLHEAREREAARKLVTERKAGV